MPEQPFNRALADVYAERQRQIRAGYDAKHDDGHANHEIITAAWGARERLNGIYMIPAVGYRRQRLIEAAAMIVAEVERLDRLNPPPV